MHRRNAPRVVLIAVMLLTLVGVLVAGVATASARQDGRSLRWDRYDVVIDSVETSANRFQVTELYTLTVERGPYTFGFAEIPLDRVENISGVRVSEDGAPLNGSCSGGPGTYCAQREGDVYAIRYYFTRQASSGDQRRIEIRYTVTGGLRSYTEGDQLWWVAVPGDLPFPVRASRITVTLPANRPPELVTTYPQEWTSSVEGSTIAWEVDGTRLGSNEVEIRVQYPHDPAMARAGWQAAADRWTTYEETYRPWVSLLLGALGILIALGGVVFVISRYLSHGRDPQALVVPEYLTEPPSDERPGIVGLLLDEQADMKDIMATLIDLARRGYIVIEQSQTGGIAGMFTKSEFTFHRTDMPASDLRDFEETLLRGLFPGGRQQTDLSTLRNKFYTHIPSIKHLMYGQLVKAGYFTRSPETTRQLWTWGGIALVVVAGGLFWLGLGATRISPLLVMPPIGLAIVGAAAAVAGNSMPAKTPKGAQDAARWRAFRRYLRNVAKYSDLEVAAQRFEDYIGYAIAFGLDKEWIRQLSPVLASMPTWYFPTYLGGPWRGGYHRRPYQPGGTLGGGGFGDISFGGPGGLNDISGSLTAGLNAMNSGMTQMLNDASRVMTSKPQSSGSGGFSGGGSRGGGGGGGGSRGFG